MKNVLVVGGGPAGLSAAIHAAQAGASVTLAERNGRTGAKLLATGGGHANISNVRPPEEWPALFGKHGRFIVPAMRHMPLSGLKHWLDDLGEPLECADGFHYFPKSNSARAVRDALLARAETLGVRILYNNRLTDIPESHDALVIATGGKSCPDTGSTGDGYALAEKLGHAVKPLHPGLVGLQTKTVPPELAGLVLPDAFVSFKRKGKKAVSDQGELLLTHTGVSGPAILDISGEAAEALGEGTAQPLRLGIRWAAELDGNFWLEQFKQWRKTHGNAPLSNRIREFIPLRLARCLCRMAGISEAGNNTPATITAKQRDTLAGLLGNFQADISGTDGWNKAMITRGGVDTTQIHPASLESRLAGQVYFAGEVLDIDGPCGGYNLHWAFASGALAGERAATS